MGERDRWVRGEHGLLSVKELWYTIEEVKHWRAVEYKAGRPSSVADFFAAHNICSKCEGQGVYMIGWGDPNGIDEIRAAEHLNVEQLPVYAVCPDCGGSGTSLSE